MSEALACLQYLADNAPAWIKSLDELQARIQRRQADVARVAVPLVPKVKKTSSNESIRNSGPHVSSPSTGSELTSTPQTYDSQQTTITAELLATPCRKRKTLSLLSAASGIHKYRSRASVTVYYDSEVQEVFDRLVRNISTGRNNIRKSRMADRVATLASMHNSVNHASDPSRNRVPMLRSVRSASGMPRFDAFIEENLRSPGGLRGLRPPPVPQPDSDVKSDIAVKRTDAREEADAALDRAQGFCEKGAHQFLRDGDCGVELAGAKTAFEDVVKICRPELERLKQQTNEARAATDETQKADPENADAVNETSISEITKPQRGSISQHPALIQDTGVIEADDDEDGSDGDYDDPSLLPLPPFRLMART